MLLKSLVSGCGTGLSDGETLDEICKGDSGRTFLKTGGTWDAVRVAQLRKGNMPIWRVRKSMVLYKDVVGVEKGCNSDNGAGLCAFSGG